MIRTGTHYINTIELSQHKVAAGPCPEELATSHLATFGPITGQTRGTPNQTWYS